MLQDRTSRHHGDIESSEKINCKNGQFMSLGKALAGLMIAAQTRALTGSSRRPSSSKFGNWIFRTLFGLGKSTNSTLPEYSVGTKILIHSIVEGRNGDYVKATIVFI